MSYETPPHLSGRPHRQQIDISAGTAFKAGFFAYFGFMCAALIVGVVVGGVMLLLGASLFAGFSSF
ncbi:hypothetical protein LX16_1029 [Stackebrandtia albiflava]|uniref:Uncharacterized protein n=1 Tax=Stackebrandtia albiflava TaxID=406432 RepID=A0A562VBS6_9ACTN|nr:hypothetical protein [Stackebrandtia albiflava]TWJ15329.1 hypothetical protein LX16_1029 [Stackebrandtia albiflava]